MTLNPPSLASLGIHSTFTGWVEVRGGLRSQWNLRTMPPSSSIILEFHSRYQSFSSSSKFRSDYSQIFKTVYQQENSPSRLSVTSAFCKSVIQQFPQRRVRLTINTDTLKDGIEMCVSNLKRNFVRIPYPHSQPTSCREPNKPKTRDGRIQISDSGTCGAVTKKII